MSCAEDDDVVVGKLGSEAQVGRVPAAQTCEVNAVNNPQELDVNDVELGDGLSAASSSSQRFPASIRVPL